MSERLLNPIGGQAAIVEIDALVLFMCLAVTLHATQHKQLKLILSGLVLGYVTETLSIRFGGTHCHASGLLNFSECSSANSILYYVPWIYSGITCGRRLVNEKSVAFPFVCGLLFFLMCGLYECQGPTMRWWLWADAEGVVKPGATLHQFGALGSDPRGMVIAEHAREALAERVFGIPALAPYFHSAFGAGIAFAFQLVGMDGSLLQHLLPVLLGPALAMVWDPPIRFLVQMLGASQAAAAAAVMLVSFLIALLAGPALGSGSGCACVPRDPLLLVAPAANTLFFVHHALWGRGAGVLPGDLKLLVTGLGLVALVAFSRAAGLLGDLNTITCTPTPAVTASRTPSDKRTKHA